MPENCSICGAIIQSPAENWGDEERPICFDCNWELAKSELQRKYFEGVYSAELDAEVERRR